MNDAAAGLGVDAVVRASERSTRAGSSGGASVGMSNKECIDHATRVYGRDEDGSATRPDTTETPAITRYDVYTMHTRYAPERTP